MHLISILNREIRVTLRRDRTELLLCFLIATVFWAMVKLSKTYETQITFAFEYLLPDSQAFIDKPPSEVKATVGGSGWNLMSFSLFHRKKELVFDLRTLPLSVVEGRVVVDRIQGQLSESSLEVKNINLDYIGLRVENKSVKRLPIRLNYELTLLPHFDFSVPPKLSPDSVLVEGPSSLVDSLWSWPTDTGQIGPLRAGLKKMIGLAMHPLSTLELDVMETELEIHVEPVVEKSIFFVPVKVKNAPNQIKIFPSSVTVYCVVGMSAYNLVDADDFSIVADLDGVALESEQNTVPLELECYADYVKSVRFSPQSAEFFFRIEQ